MVDTNLVEVAAAKNEDKTLFPTKGTSSGKKPHVSYASDGRKLHDGLPVDVQPPEVLWEETLVRAAAVHQVHKATDGHCCDTLKDNTDNSPVNESEIVITGVGKYKQRYFHYTVVLTIVLGIDSNNPNKSADHKNQHKVHLN